MDCSWGYGLNKACDGGDYDAAMDYLKLAGGPLQERDYEYLGADGFCRDRNFSSGQRATFEVLTYILCHWLCRSNVHPESWISNCHLVVYLALFLLDGS